MDYQLLEVSSVNWTHRAHVYHPGQSVILYTKGRRKANDVESIFSLDGTLVCCCSVEFIQYLNVNLSLSVRDKVLVPNTRFHWGKKVDYTWSLLLRRGHFFSAVLITALLWELDCKRWLDFYINKIFPGVLIHLYYLLEYLYEGNSSIHWTHAPGAVWI